MKEIRNKTQSYPQNFPFLSIYLTNVYTILTIFQAVF